MKYRLALSVAAAVLGGGVLARPGAAQHVAPLVYDLTPHGAGASQKVVVWNSHHAPAAIDTLVEPLGVASTGARQSTDSDGTIIVTPAQFLLQPGEKRSVDVRYAGTAAAVRSRTYKVHFRQLPLPLAGAKDSSGVRFLIDFATVAHVVPANSQPDVRHSVVQVSDRVATVRFNNLGTRYSRLDAVALTIQTANGSIRLEPADLADRPGLGWILPQEVRTVDIDLRLPAAAPANVAAR